MLKLPLGNVAKGNIAKTTMNFSVIYLNPTSQTKNITSLVSNRITSLFSSVPAKHFVIAMLLFLSANSYAQMQCNTFENADEANPLKAAFENGQTYTSLDFADIDNDGDKDCFLVPPHGLPVLYRNTGDKNDPVFEKSATSGFENTVTPDGSPVIQFTDIDGDGDYDCFITEISNVSRPVTGIRFYRNIGDKTHPQFMEDEDNNPVSFARSGNNYVQFTFADIDKDGDADFYYTGFYNTTLSDFDQYTYLNNGAPQTPVFTLFTNDHPHDFKRERTYYDWNNDGLPDYIKYDDFQNTYSFLKNNGPAQLPVYSVPADDVPVFDYGMPFRLVDLNNDNAPESFTREGRYSIVAPLAVIEKDEKQIKNITVTKLFSANQSSGLHYQWEYNGRLLSGISTSFIYAARPGNYVLYITNDCGTGVSLPYALTGKQWHKGNDENGNFSAGYLPAITSATKISAYPNPFTSAVTVQLPASKTSVTSTIKITDMAGKILFSKTTSAAAMQVGQALQRGTYLIQVWQKNKLIYHTILIKQ